MNGIFSFAIPELSCLDCLIKAKIKDVQSAGFPNRFMPNSLPD